MVVSKKILCHTCNKKCSGNVLRYQDRYYHKQCFEIEQTSNERHASIENFSDKNHTPNANLPSQPSPISSNYSHNTIDSSPTNRQMGSANKNIHTQNNNSISRNNKDMENSQQSHSKHKSQTIDSRSYLRSKNLNSATPANANASSRSATLPHSASSPANGFLSQTISKITSCAGCGELIRDGQALIALDLHWHVWCFKCNHCKNALHGEYVAKDGKAYCEKDYQKLYGVVCVYCKRFITGKVLQAGEAHHFHPSCARCSKCGDPFVPGEEMYLQGEVTWHPRCGPGPDHSGPIDESDLDASSRSPVSFHTHFPAH